MRRRTALLAGGATSVALALGALAGGVLAESRGSTPGTAAPVALADRALTGAAASIGASATRTLELRVRTEPTDAQALTELGFAYQLRWRETADASYLPRSEAALTRAARYGTDDANAVLGLGSLGLIRHEFRTALMHGRRAQRLLPGSYRPYGVVGDALLELGRYDEAFAAFDRMISLRPTLASYARVAYARELVGDRPGAVAAMRLALESASGQPEPTAWAHVELAKLELALGHVGAARRHTSAALRVLPGYPSARVELAQVEAAAGNLTARSGRRDSRPTRRRRRRPSRCSATSSNVPVVAARRADQRETVAVIDRLLAPSGVRVDLESAVYRADNLIRPSETVALAGRARADRSLDLRRRCTRLGARAGGPLRRGDPLARARTAARDAGRAPALPPRLHGGLRRRRAEMRTWYDTGARPPIPRSPCVGRRSRAHSSPARADTPPTYHPRRESHPCVARALAGRRGGCARRTRARVPPDVHPTDPFHEYLAHAPQVLLLLTLSGLALAGFGPRRDAPPAWIFPLVAVATFVGAGARRADRARRRRADPRHDACLPCRPGAAAPSSRSSPGSSRAACSPSSQRASRQSLLRPRLEFDASPGRARPRRGDRAPDRRCRAALPSPVQSR